VNSVELIQSVVGIIRAKSGKPGKHVGSGLQVVVRPCDRYCTTWLSMPWFRRFCPNRIIIWGWRAGGCPV